MRTDWIDFYAALADSLKKYSPEGLFETICSLAAGRPFLGYMHFEDDELWQKRGRKLDPFSVMAIFNRGQTDGHRREIAEILAGVFGVALQAPDCYHGIPYLDPRNSIYGGDAEMWALFSSCLDGPDNAAFADAYTAAKDERGNALGTLSIGLFWMRPLLFMPVDRVSAPYIYEIGGIKTPAEKCSGQEYAAFLRKLSSILAPKRLTYPEIAYAAWLRAHPGLSCQLSLH